METNEKKLIYNEIPKQVAREDFNKYINPHLRKPVKGPKPKLSFYKIFQLHPVCLTYWHPMEPTQDKTQ